MLPLTPLETTARRERTKYQRPEPPSKPATFVQLCTCLDVKEISGPAHTTTKNASTGKHGARQHFTICRTSKSIRSCSGAVPLCITATAQTNSSRDTAPRRAAPKASKRDSIKIFGCNMHHRGVKNRVRVWCWENRNEISWKRRYPQPSKRPRVRVCMRDIERSSQRKIVRIEGLRDESRESVHLLKPARENLMLEAGEADHAHDESKFCLHNCVRFICRPASAAEANSRYHA